MIREALAADIPTLVGLLEQLFSIEEDFEADERRQHKGLTMVLDSLIGKSFAAAEWLKTTKQKPSFKIVTPPTRFTPLSITFSSETPLNIWKKI